MARLGLGSLTVVSAVLLLCGAPRAEQAPGLDPVLQKLGGLVGGRWEAGKNADGVPFAEVQFDWSADRKLITGRGTIGKGTPRPLPTEVRLGWDPATRQVYYLDCHGAETVYFGHVRLEGETLVYEFKTLVGKPGEWTIRERFVDADTLRSEFQAWVDGKPAGEPQVLEMKRASR